MKRLFDLVVAGILLVIMFPVSVIVALLVLVDMGRPVLFAQTRPGLKGKPFRIYKFRTLRVPSEDGLIHESDVRQMTRVGRFLRVTSLDELPQLWNVIKGDMSLVGPRPLLMSYLPLYNDFQMRRHNVRPGITGWAQVNGRNDLSWPEKFELDVWYVDNQTFLLDLRILAMTVGKVIAREGVTTKGKETSEPFVGNAK